MMSAPGLEPSTSRALFGGAMSAHFPDRQGKGRVGTFFSLPLGIDTVADAWFTTPVDVTAGMVLTTAGMVHGTNPYRDNPRGAYMVDDTTR